MKTVSTTSVTTRKHLTKEEKSIRGGIEDDIKGFELSSNPPKHLTRKQKIVYRWLYDNLAPSQILSTLDIQSIVQACIVIERLNNIDRQIDQKLQAGEGFDKALESIRKDYFTQYLKICGELCLSPAARAKMGSMCLSAYKAKKDALMDALGE